MFQRARFVDIVASPRRLSVGRVNVAVGLCEGTGSREEKEQKDESCPPPFFVDNS